MIKCNFQPGTQEPVVLELNLADFDTLDTFIQKVYDQCGNIDILVNNGGISFRGSIIETKIEVDKEIMSVNYFGSVALTKGKFCFLLHSINLGLPIRIITAYLRFCCSFFSAVLPKMVMQKSGHIVFVSSVQGLIAIPDRSAYAASKHALQAFGDSLRAEMHQHNINVTVISPGYIKTNISLNALNGAGNNYGG